MVDYLELARRMAPGADGISIPYNPFLESEKIIPEGNLDEEEFLKGYLGQTEFLRNSDPVVLGSLHPSYNSLADPNIRTQVKKILDQRVLDEKRSFGRKQLEDLVDYAENEGEEGILSLVMGVVSGFIPYESGSDDEYNHLVGQIRESVETINLLRASKKEKDLEDYATGVVLSRIKDPLTREFYSLVLRDSRGRDHFLGEFERAETLEVIEKVDSYGVKRFLSKNMQIAHEKGKNQDEELSKLNEDYAREEDGLRREEAPKEALEELKEKYQEKGQKIIQKYKDASGEWRKASEMLVDGTAAYIFAKKKAKEDKKDKE